MEKTSILFFLFVLTMFIRVQAAETISCNVRWYYHDSKGKIEITGIGAVAGEIIAEAEISNPSAAHLDLFLAVYSGNMLEDVRYYSAGGEAVTKTMQINLSGDADGKSVRLFVWQENQQPAAHARLYGKGGSIRYISPSGNDLNDGSYEFPWKTLQKAATTAMAGMVIVLEDGDYTETVTTRFKNSGEQDAPIIVQSRNKHKAKLIYAEKLKDTYKVILAEGQGFYTFSGLYYTQESISADRTTDIYIFSRASDCRILSNRFEDAFEEAVKLSAGADRTVVEDNIILRMAHEGIDSLNTDGVIIRNNKIIDVGRVGIMVKGGARNNLVSNNFIANYTRPMSIAAVTLGGETNSTSPYNIEELTGFEAYNCVFYNNIIYSAEPTLIATGISFISSVNCYAYNNIISGPENGVKFSKAPGKTKNGWGWDPPVQNPSIMRNIFIGCLTRTYWSPSIAENLASDYNLYFQTPGLPPYDGDSKNELHSMFNTDPLFVETNGNWTLGTGSPLENDTAVTRLIEGFDGNFDNEAGQFDGKFDGKTLKIDIVNFDAMLQQKLWEY